MGLHEVGGPKRDAFLRQVLEERNLYHFFVLKPPQFSKPKYYFINDHPALIYLQEDDQTYNRSSSRAMASGAGKPAIFFLFFVNLVLYLIVTIIASWAVNHGIEETHEQASVLSIPARIFPIYYPFGNMATGYVVILSLLAGVTGFTTSATGLSNVAAWDTANLYAASASSLFSWSLTLLAMGFACKEIDISWSGSTMRALEAILIIVSGTQLFGMIAIHAGIEEVSKYGTGGIV